jgi:hypothetical protein
MQRERLDRLTSIVALALGVFALAFVGCGAGHGGERSPARHPVTIPFRIVDGWIVVDAFVDENKVPVILDTGGSTIISKRIGRGGLSSVRLGGLRKVGVRTAAVPGWDHSPAACAASGGALGAAFFRNTAIQISFGASEIRLANSAAELDVRGAVRLPFTPVHNGSPTPRVPATVGSRRLALELDTGVQRYLVLEPLVARTAGARVDPGVQVLDGEALESPSGPGAGSLAFTGLSRLRLGELTRRKVLAGTGSAVRSSNALGVQFMRDFVVTIDWAGGAVYLERAGRLGDGAFRTYGYLPKLTDHGIVAGAVERGGPAEANGLAGGDPILRAGDRSLKHPTFEDFCASYSEAFAPTRDLQPITFFHQGERNTGDLTAVEIGPEAFSRPPSAERLRPVPGGAGGERSLLVEGDSLGIGSRPYLAGALPGWRLEHSVLKGRTTAQGVAILRAWSGTLPRVIVMSLGTNDDPRATAAFRAAIRETLAIAGPRRCVVWVNIVRPPFGGVSYAGLNEVLSREAERSTKLIVVDWAGVVRGHPEWLAPDHVHLTPAGYEARAGEIAQAVQGCG